MAVAKKKAAAPPVAAKPSPVEIFDAIEQNSPEWFELRRGIPTASNFSTIMASGKDGGPSVTRTKLMYRLAGEILTGVPAETFKSGPMSRGNEMEDEARDYYVRTTFADVRRIGFMRRKLPSGHYVGASPDGLIGANKALEIKTLAPDLMIERLEKGAQGMPSEHRAQTHGIMWVGDLDEVDLLLFYRGMPVAPKYTIRRDDAYIKEISNAVEIFEYDLRKLVEKIRAMGGVR